MSDLAQSVPAVTDTSSKGALFSGEVAGQCAGRPGLGVLAFDAAVQLRGRRR